MKIVLIHFTIYIVNSTTIGVGYKNANEEAKFMINFKTTMSHTENCTGKKLEDSANLVVGTNQLSVKSPTSKYAFDRLSSNMILKTFLFSPEYLDDIKGLKPRVDPSSSTSLTDIKAIISKPNFASHINSFWSPILRAHDNLHSPRAILPKPNKDLKNSPPQNAVDELFDRSIILKQTFDHISTTFKPAPNYTIAKTQKGYAMIFFENCFYTLHHKSSIAEYYRCRMRKCNGRGKLCNNTFSTTILHTKNCSDNKFNDPKLEDSINKIKQTTMNPSTVYALNGDSPCSPCLATPLSSRSSNNSINSNTTIPMPNFASNGISSNRSILKTPDNSFSLKKLFDSQDCTINYEITKTRKGSFMVLYKNCHYTLHQASNQIQYYRCRVRSCRGRGKIIDKIFYPTNSHTENCGETQLKNSKSAITINDKIDQISRISSTPNYKHDPSSSLVSETFSSKNAPICTPDRVPNFIMSQTLKGSSMVVFENCHYTLNLEHNQVRYYRCRKRPCKGRGKIVDKTFYLTNYHTEKCKYFTTLKGNEQKSEDLKVDVPSSSDTKETNEIPCTSTSPCVLSDDSMCSEISESSENSCSSNNSTQTTTPTTSEGDLNYKVSKTQKGAYMIFYENCFYTLHQKSAQGHYFRCRVRECRGRGKFFNNKFYATNPHTQKCTQNKAMNSKLATMVSDREQRITDIIGCLASETGSLLALESAYMSNTNARNYGK